MKVALCLSGQARTFRRCFASHFKMLMKPFNADVFIHTWSFSGDHKRTSKDHHYTNDYDISLYEKYNTTEYLTDSVKLIELYCPKKMLIEKPDKEYFMRKTPIDSFFNALMMYYSVYRANELRREYEIERGIKYDLVIRSRFDLRINKFNIDKLNENSIYLAPNQCINYERSSQITGKPVEQLREETKSGFMPSDQFAFGCSEGMNYYSSLYEIWTPETHPIHPEGMMSKHLWGGMRFTPVIYDGVSVDIVRA